MTDFIDITEALGAYPGIEDANAFASYVKGRNVYKESLYLADGILFMVNKTDPFTKELVAVTAEPHLLAGLTTNTSIHTGRYMMARCPMNVANAYWFMARYKNLGPKSMKDSKVSVGLGDRLGLVTAGHVSSIRKASVFPVFAQQSIRELNLTGRTFKDVLADAFWGAFRAGWRKGFGADGDHLKTAEEVRYALDSGFSMITLDCSNHIGLEREGGANAKPPSVRAQVSYRLADGTAVSFSEDEIERCTATYQRAIEFTSSIYHDLLVGCGRKVDFELSIDETGTPTDPKAHYFVAKQLADTGVPLTSLAPRFIGEFQKGIDYIGDIAKFREDFVLHQAIADTFGYKLSVHSGSDKFSIYPSVAELSKGHFHLKTAGTNWLEALRVVFAANPELFGQMYSYAKEHLDEAKAYYKVDVEKESVPDSVDAALFERPDVRQVMHITYGLLLNAKTETGEPLFRTRLYRCLRENEDLLRSTVERHIDNHLKALGLIWS
ncbi:MAG TPA: tagaturonate epimerase family protein [Bacillota bacterium]|nr:tagaturonate epimerase family protein [Bacillota bacterium]